MSRTMSRTTRSTTRTSNRSSSRAGHSSGGRSDRHPLVQFRRLMQSRTSSIILFIFIVFITVSLTKSVLRKNEIQRQITALENEIQSVEASNTDLQDLLNYFNSSEYQEKEARTKLGLREEGETVLLIPQPETSLDELDPLTPEVGQTTEESSNISKWFTYFFQ